MKLRSPLPAWLKAGRAHVRMSVESVDEKSKRHRLSATPEMPPNAKPHLRKSAGTIPIASSAIQKAIRLRRHKEMNPGDSIIADIALE